ncbi:MAG: class I SAM-dependent methyltransferase [Candidatus Omnitrophica bacterium]|nr:class I SAM-dependent methyltransferase [Candidatus Omnitrophota bacterium]MBU1923880.1 class I SAM-dependent methyltransferase [Candidatus Omnitrophota bacterium]
MVEIENTGERILLEKETPLMIARHFCAYKFARVYSSGKEVLDIGCGEGYGSGFLAEVAKGVLGIDYDAAIIDYAKDKYHKENLKFSCLNVDNLGSLTRKFDLICSFQNIEHIRDAHKLLKNITNLLKEGGIFICSTCNIKDASPGRESPFNKFHVKEYLASEFKELLQGHFKKVEIFGLRRGMALRFNRRLKKIGLFKFLPDKLDPVKKFFVKANCSYFSWTRKDLDNCLDFIAVCNE